KPQDLDSGLQINFLAPAPEEAVPGRQRDAVDPSMRAAGRRSPDRALPAPSARAVDVIEGGHRAGSDGSAVHVEDLAGSIQDFHQVYVARNDGIWHPIETAVP